MGGYRAVILSMLGIFDAIDHQGQRRLRLRWIQVRTNSNLPGHPG